MSAVNEKTEPDYWNEVWKRSPRMRMPSPLNVITADRMRILRKYLRPGMRYLEIGCAPGKLLAYTAGKLGVKACGLDYSPIGVAWTRRLFDTLGLQSDVRCEDVFATSFEPASFDVVHSAGVIEHFNDPSDIVRAHVKLVKPGGLVLITIPNLAGVYRGMAEYFDRAAVRTHNLEIMNCKDLAALAPAGLSGEVNAYPAGRISFGPVHFHRKLPAGLAAAVFYGSNLIGLLQPFEIRGLCPQLVLTIVRKES